MEFTEEEVKEKLKELGYVNVPANKLREFMHDLQDLVEHDQSNSLTSIEDSRYDSCAESDYFSEDQLMENSSLQDRNGRQRSAIFKEKVTSRGYHTSNDKENTMLNSTDNEYSLSSTITSNQYERTGNDHPSNYSGVRRKVARKKNGQTRVFDETFSDNCSEAADITINEERTKNLPFANGETIQRLWSSRSMLSQNSVGTTSSQASLPAFIRSSRTHPHTKSLRKCDPVSRYHQFKSEWKQNKLPGESNHSGLRWKVREQMLNYEAFEKPRHKPTVNNYVVPTDKKRQALRWQVRTALAKV